MIKSIFALGIKKNKLLALPLVLLSFGIFFFAMTLIPIIIYPKGRMIDIFKKEVYGDLIVHIETDKLGVITPQFININILYDPSVLAISTFKDDSVFDEISSLKIVSSVMKRTISKTKRSHSAKYYYLNEEKSLQPLTIYLQSAGIDFALADEFYKDNKYAIYPSLANKSEGIMIREKDYNNLKKRGIVLQEGDTIVIEDFYGATYQRPFIGTIKDVSSSDSFECPEGKVYFGAIVDNALLQELNSIDVKYKFYIEAPTTLDQIELPGLTDISFDTREKMEVGYDQILIHLKDGISEKKAIKQIDEILAKYNNSEKPYRYKVASSYLNVFYEFDLRIDNESKKNNKAVSLITITALFIIGTIT